MEGDGKLIIRDLYTYVGAFESNKFHGYGELTELCGVKYEGDFYRGRPHGKGKLTTKEGD